jgi:hypothetical protein
MSAPQPQITFLMPAYNPGELVRPALESVLAQTISDWRLLVVDDGSTDGTAEVVESYGDERIRVLRQANAGQTAAMNNGLQEIDTPWVARLDQDDLAAPERAERQLAHLAAHAGTVLLGSWADYIDERDEFVKAFRPPTSAAAVRAALLGELLANPLIHSSATFSADAARRAGGYPDGMRYAQDYGLWVRLLAHGDAEVLGEVLCLVRTHPGQASGDRAVALRMWREVLAGGEGLDTLLGLGGPEGARWERGRAELHAHMAIAEILEGERREARPHLAAIARTLRTTPAALLDVLGVVGDGVRHRAGAMVGRR